MQTKILVKPLSAAHVWAFVPTPVGVSQELRHSIEHRVFLDSGIAALEDEVVRHNGMTFWTGIRLDFTIPPKRAGELVRAVEGLFEKPLPKMSFEERERFARELEEGGGDFFDAAVDRFKRALFEANGWKHSGKDEEEIWGTLDADGVRFLVVGNVDVSARGHWSPFAHEDLVFPTLKEEVTRKEGDEEDSEGIDPRDAPMDYALLFPSRVTDVDEFAFHELFSQLLRMKIDAEFRDTGRTYDPVSEKYFEDGFVVSGLHLMTSDTDKRLPNLPKKPDARAFEKFRDSLAFQMAIDHDQLVYGDYLIVGLDPAECLEAVRRYRYDDFAHGFDAATKRVSLFWGRGW